MINEKYSARMVKSPTFYREVIEVGTLKLQGFEGKDLKNKLLDENPLHITPARRNKEISAAVLVRVNTLTQSELNLLVNGSVSDKKQMVMLSIMKTERIVREFINEVYLEKLDIGQTSLEDVDFNFFFRRKQEEEEAVEKWQDVTIKKLKQVFKKILKELDFIKVDGKTMELLPPFVSANFIKAIEGEEIIITKVFRR